MWLGTTLTRSPILGRAIARPDIDFAVLFGEPHDLRLRIFDDVPAAALRLRGRSDRT